jgi:putative acetyltransferase
MMDQDKTPVIAIRAIRASDAAPMAAIRGDAAVLPNLLALPFQRVADAEAWYAKLTPNDYAVVAEIDGVVAGSASLHRQGGRRAHVALLGMMVAPDWQGQGVGSALMRDLITLADRWLDLKRLELNVFADNSRAIALYRKFGFVIEGRQRGYAFRDGSYADSLSMARLNFLASLAPAPELD